MRNRVSAQDVAPRRLRKRSCCRQRLRRAATLLGRMLAGYAKSLPVFFRGVQSLFTVGERTRDGGPQPPAPVFKGRTTFFWKGFCQISNQRVHAPHHLHASGAIKADLIKSQPNEIVPCGKWNHESQFAVAVAIFPISKWRWPRRSNKSSIWSSACTAVVGSLIAGDKDLIAISTRSRIAYLGSCSNVRCAPSSMVSRNFCSSTGSSAPKTCVQASIPRSYRPPLRPSRWFRWRL